MPKREDMQRAFVIGAAPSSSARPAGSTTPAPRPAGAARGGIPGRSRKLEPDTIAVTRAGRRHLRGAHYRLSWKRSSRAARCVPAHPRRPDGPEHGRGTGQSGVLERYGVGSSAATWTSSSAAGPQTLPASAWRGLGIEVSRAGYACSVEDALSIADRLGFPWCLRPSFTMGGAGGGIARDAAGFAASSPQGLELFGRRGARGGVHRGLEGIRDGGHARWGRQRHHRVSCIEFRIMGVHTGDSITVAPAQTLTDLGTSACAPRRRRCWRRVGVARAA